jgi:hypothetical protein
MSPCPSEVGAEEVVVNAVLWLKLAVETVGALVIAVGMLLAGWSFVAGFPPVVVTFAIGALSRNCARISLGPDILSTAVAPSWDAIGKLAAVAIIRTAFNYFLGRDMQETDTQAGQAEVSIVTPALKRGRARERSPFYCQFW